MRDTGLQFVFPVLSVWPGGRGEARLLVFSMGWNFWLGAELFSRLNSFVFAPRVQSSSSETAGPFEACFSALPVGPGVVSGGPAGRGSVFLSTCF